MNVQSTSAIPTLSFGLDALGVLLPFHLTISETGNIQSTGPTLAKLAGDMPLLDEPFLDVFKIRRPAAITMTDALFDNLGVPLQVTFAHDSPLRFRGVALPIENGAGCVLINLSCGVHTPKAVAQFELSLTDFAVTDLAVEMLYLMEARELAMEQAKRLIRRLDYARVIAQNEAVTDPLTQLPNRRGLDQHLDILWMGDKDLSILMIDLDLFKQVNDDHGHAAGDFVLKTVAARLTDATRAGDFIARVGGDEFVVVLNGLSDPEILGRAATRIIGSVGSSVEYEGQVFEIGASGGAAARPAEAGYTLAEVFTAADKALYAVKGKGRGCALVGTVQGAPR